MKVLIKNPKASKLVRIVALLLVLSGTHANLALYAWDGGYAVGREAGFFEGVMALAKVLGIVSSVQHNGEEI